MADSRFYIGPVGDLMREFERVKASLGQTHGHDGYAPVGHEHPGHDHSQLEKRLDVVERAIAATAKTLAVHGHDDIKPCSCKKADAPAKTEAPAKGRSSTKVAAVKVELAKPKSTSTRKAA